MAKTKRKKKFQLNNKDLRRMFMYNNHRFFNNQIPDHIAVVFGKVKHYPDLKDASGFYDHSEQKIVIDEVLSSFGKSTETIVLHEMAHARLVMDGYLGNTDSGERHGMRFQAEIVRLFNAGSYDGLL